MDVFSGLLRKSARVLFKVTMTPVVAGKGQLEVPLIAIEEHRQVSSSSKDVLSWGRKGLSRPDL